MHQQILGINSCPCCHHARNFGGGLEWQTVLIVSPNTPDHRCLVNFFDKFLLIIFKYLFVKISEPNYPASEGYGSAPIAFAPTRIHVFTCVHPQPCCSPNSSLVFSTFAAVSIVLPLLTHYA